MARYPCPPSKEDDGHPSQETRNLRPDDRRLRENGFEIVSRAKHGPNRWGRNRDVYGRCQIDMTEAEASEWCDKRERNKEAAKAK